MINDRSKHDIFCVGLGSQDVACYLRNEQLNPSISVICFKCEVLLIETFPESVIRPNANMVIYGILFGGIHPINVRTFFFFRFFFFFWGGGVTIHTSFT